MSNFTKTTNFTAKDALTSGDPNKVIKGSEFDTEFDNLATASATKSNKIIAGTVNNVIKQDSAGDLIDSGYQFSELVGNVTITTAEANILDGVTSTTAELNILDGATLDVTELNYVDGVTSSIQTQLDSKGTEAYADALVDDLSGVTDAATARTNLGLGSLAVLSQLSSRTELPDFVAGDSLLESSDTERSSLSATARKLKEFTIQHGGTYRIKFDLKNDTASQTGYGQLYKNGSTEGTLRSVVGTTYTTFSEDIALVSGDLLQLYCWAGAFSGVIRNFRMYANNNMPVSSVDTDYP